MNNIQLPTLIKRVEWVMGHRIAGHPMDQHLHGHRFVLDAEFLPHGEIDIGDIKALLTRTVVAPLDHCFVFDNADKVIKQFFTKNPTLKHIIVFSKPTMEHMLLWIVRALEKDTWFATHLRLCALTLWESPTSSATLRIKNRTKKIVNVL